MPFRRNATIETRATTATTGAHARRVDVPPVAAPRHPLRSSSVVPQQLRAERRVRRRDRGRHRRRTAALLHDPRPGEPRRGRRGPVRAPPRDGIRSMIELDERELGELEVELDFVRAGARARSDHRDRSRGRAAAEVGSRRGPAEARVEPMPPSPKKSSPTMRVAECRMSPTIEGPTDDEATSARTSRTSRSHTARPGLRSRSRMSGRTGSEDRGNRRGGRFDDRGVRGDGDGVDDDDIRVARRCGIRLDEGLEARESPDVPDVADIADVAPLRSVAPIPADEAIAQVALAKGIAFVAHHGKPDRSGARTSTTPDASPSGSTRSPSPSRPRHHGSTT